MDKNLTELLPGWKIFCDETSNGVYEISLTYAYGRKTGIIDKNSVMLNDMNM